MTLFDSYEKLFKGKFESVIFETIALLAVSAFVVFFIGIVLFFSGDFSYNLIVYFGLIVFVSLFMLHIIKIIHSIYKYTNAVEESEKSLICIITEVKKEVKELQYIIKDADIEIKIQDVVKRIDIAENDNEMMNKKNNRGSELASGKRLSEWKEVFPAMMKVYHRCMEEGERPRQGPDFNAMFNEFDAELTDTQMRFFRSCLPEGHSDTDGGKPGKV